MYRSMVQSLHKSTECSNVKAMVCVSVSLCVCVRACDSYNIINVTHCESQCNMYSALHMFWLFFPPFQVIFSVSFSLFRMWFLFSGSTNKSFFFQQHEVCTSNDKQRQNNIQNKCDMENVYSIYLKHYDRSV